MVHRAVFVVSATYSERSEQIQTASNRASALSNSRADCRLKVCGGLSEDLPTLCSTMSVYPYWGDPLSSYCGIRLHPKNNQHLHRHNGLVDDHTLSGHPSLYVVRTEMAASRPTGKNAVSVSRLQLRVRLPQSLLSTTQHCGEMCSETDIPPPLGHLASNSLKYEPLAHSRYIA